MSEITTFQLQTSAILDVPICNYTKDFTFIVNDEEFQTTKVLADLLSPKISQMHRNDPTFNSYRINTSNKGHFEHFLQLANFSQETIPKEELAFISEILNDLQSNHITLNLPPRNSKITINNIVDLIKLHETNQHFYKEYFNEELEFISSHFYELNEDQEQRLRELRIDTIDQIVSRSDLKLRDENQLLNILNELYQSDSSYANLYKYVFFPLVDEETILKFIDHFDIFDLDTEIWIQLSSRLSRKVTPREEDTLLTSRYSKSFPILNTEKEITCQHDNQFDGIINFLRKETNGNIENAINITSSSVYYSCVPYNVCLFEDEHKGKYFETNNEKNSWICFDFKDRKIIPKNYLIQTGQGKACHNPRTWILEGSNDQTNWETLDKQDDCPYLNEQYVVHTFDIQKQNTNPFRYIRIMQTGPNWFSGDWHYFVLGSVEFYGSLIRNS